MNARVTDISFWCQLQRCLVNTLHLTFCDQPWCAPQAVSALPELFIQLSSAVYRQGWLPVARSEADQGLWWGAHVLWTLQSDAFSSRHPPQQCLIRQSIFQRTYVWFRRIGQVLGPVSTKALESILINKFSPTSSAGMSENLLRKCKSATYNALKQ